MSKRIAIIDGHPDSASDRFCHALAQTYAEGAEAGGHETKTIEVATLDFALLRSAADWEAKTAPSPLVDAQQTIAWADHLVFICPLWLGSMPAILKGFLEQVFRPGFAIKMGERTLHPGLLTGKSARVVITMGMPALVYRWYFRAHSLKSFERNILRFVGIGSIAETLIGNVAGKGTDRARWLDRIRAFGREAK